MLSQWKKNNRGGQIFSRIAIVARDEDDFSLKLLDLNGGTFGKAEWPAEWARTRELIESRLQRRNRFGQPGTPGAPPNPGMRPGGDGLVLEVPLWQQPSERNAGPDSNQRGRGFFTREIGWLLVELNTDTSATC